MKLIAHPLTTDVATIRPADSHKEWMDQTSDRFAYRCTPLPIANASGWEISLPCEFEAEWDGGIGSDAIKIKWPEGKTMMVGSHFGSGILTFHTGYVFRTDPGIATWVRGAPNSYKEGIFALDGLVETYWLPFSFTMNWKFTKPGKIKFEKDETFCFITLFQHDKIDKVTPVIQKGDDQFIAEYNAWANSRKEFNEKLENRDPETVKQKWQKNYFKGISPTGKTKASFHVARRKLNPFVEK